MDLRQYVPGIKKGDQLKIDLQHALVSYSYTAGVEDDGSLVLPGFEKLQVLGMTTRALEDLLAVKSRTVHFSSAWLKTVHESPGGAGAASSESAVEVSSESTSGVSSESLGAASSGRSGADPAVVSSLFSPKVTIANYRISVLGLVERPGQYPVPQQQITVFEALALAGYKTINTKHGTIKVLREAADGQLIFYTLHLNDKSIVNSPAYYLEQNDVLYVHPTRTGKWASGLSSPLALGVASLVSLLISAATLVVHIVKP
ncbi:MAG TPA: SLBB domain-containing protein [Bacteroidales bacterium]|nr:SLBB domain-containing protein [Bacteroidales bacterium]